MATPSLAQLFFGRLANDFRARRAERRGGRRAPRLEILEPRILLSADLVGSVEWAAPADPLVPGDDVHASVLVRNLGDKSSGSFDVRLYASADAVLDGSDLLLDSASVSGGLKAGKSRDVGMDFELPDGLRPGEYRLLAMVDPGNKVQESNEANNVSAGPAFDLRWIFGEIPGRPGSHDLSLRDADGTCVRFELSGPGRGEVVLDGSQWDVVITGSTAASVLTISTDNGGNDRVSLDDIQVGGPLQALVAPTMDLTGTLAIGGALGAGLLIGSADGALITAPSLQGLDVFCLTVQGIAVLGDLTDSQIRIGGGSLGDLLIGGEMDSSRISVGQDPVDGIYDNGNDTLNPGGAIRSVTILDEMSADSRITAPNLPDWALVDWRLIPTVNDARFVRSIARPNQAPDAADDSFATQEDTALTLAAASLSANDSDPDGDALTVTAVQAGADTHGTVELANGQITYTPDANYNGTATFSYSISDGHGGSDSATVSVIIDPVNDAPVAADDDFALQGVVPPLMGVLVGNLLTNDADVDQDALSIVLADPSATEQRFNTDYGRLTLEADGDLFWSIEKEAVKKKGLKGDSDSERILRLDAGDVVVVAADADGEDLLYTVSDGAETDEGAFQLTITGVNDAPEAFADSLFTYDDVAVTMERFLEDHGFDWDDDDVLTVAVGDAPHGSVAYDALTDTLTYTPDGGYIGADSFEFTVTDSHGESASALIEVTVAEQFAPVAADGTLSTDEDTSAAGVLQATDANLDPVTFEIVGGAQHGTVTLIDAATGAYSYSPAPDFNGTDSFTFLATDGGRDSNIATVTITVAPVNDGPVAVEDDFAVQGVLPPLLGGQLVGNVLANDDDVDGDALGTTAAIFVTDYGSLTLEEDGDLFWQVGKKATKKGVDPSSESPSGRVLSLAEGDVAVVDADSGGMGLAYAASDGLAQDEGAFQLTITGVNDAPEAFGDSLSTDSGVAIVLEDFLANYAFDWDDGDTLDVTVGGAEHGVVAYDALSDTLTYTPDAGYFGPDSFEFTVTDSHDLSASALVDVSIIEPEFAPIAADGSLSTDEDTPAGGLLQATDANFDPLTFSIVGNAQHGTVALIDAATGEFTYTPAPNFNGADSFTFFASDGGLNSNTATVTVTVNAVNDAPVAQDAALDAVEGVVATGVLVATDADADALAYSIVSQGSKGTVVITDAATGAFTYTPNANATGADSFAFVASDGSADSNVATVSVTVNEVNVAPELAFIGDRAVDEGSLLSFFASAVDANAGQVLTFALAQAPEGAAIDPVSGQVTWSPTEGQGPAVYGFEVLVTDNGVPALQDSEAFTVSVNEINAAPVLASIGNKALTLGGELTFQALASDADLPANALTFTLAGDVPAGASITADGFFSWTPSAAQVGTSLITVRVADESVASFDEETIAVQVNASRISIGDVTVTEGNSGVTSVLVTLSLDQASDVPITVDYATQSGTASEASDYLAASGTVTFQPGQTSRQIGLSVLGDAIVEGNEAFAVALSNPTRALIADPSATVTITNDDTLPALSISDRIVTEGNSGTTGAAFSVTLDKAYVLPVSVDYWASGGTAAAGVDFTAVTGSLTFAPGETSKTVTVQVSGDAAFEGNETFSVALRNPSNATLADGTGTGTINNDDAAPTISIGNDFAPEGDAGSNPLVFRVQLSSASPLVTTVQYATALDTAEVDDFTAASGTITFQPGETDQWIVVNARGDNSTESDERFFVDLSNPVNATLSDAQGIGTIGDDEDFFEQVSIENAVISEGGGSALFVVAFTGTSIFPDTANIHYSVTSGTATAGSDFSAVSGNLTLELGETGTISVPISQDSVYELDGEYFIVTITSNVDVDDGTGIGLILDDEQVPSLSIGNVAVTEGGAGASTNAVFTLTSNRASALPMTVQYATGGGSAVGGSDYTSTSGLVTFAPGETSKQITVVVSGDTDVEPSENFNVTLSNATGASIGDGSGQATINNDDTRQLTISNVTLAEGDSGTTDAVFTVTLSAPSNVTTSVSYQTANGTATAGSDYQSRTGSLSFAPGETSKTIAVPVIGDMLLEPNETFNVNLSGAINATILDNQGVGTITNDDALPGISIGNVSVQETDAGASNAVFSVSLTSASPSEVSIGFATVDGSAAGASDYVPTAGTLVIPAGMTGATISIPLLGDTVAEPTETFFVHLSSPVNATIVDGEGQATIGDNDPVLISIDDVAVTEGDSGATSATFTVSLSQANFVTTTVRYHTAGGTASTQDYVPQGSPVPVLLSFAPGETSKTVSVAVNGDTVLEANETFNVVLSSAVNAQIADGTGVGTILNDDATPEVSIADVVVPEPNTGTGNARFLVRLSAPSPTDTTVQFETADGTASQGGDYLATSGTLVIAAGATQGEILVPVVGDTAVEADETFFVNLFNPGNATLASSQARGTIANNDAVRISVDDVSVLEGNSGTTSAVFTVSLSQASTAATSVSYMIGNGTATAGVDYAATSGSLSFAAGETAKTVTVQVNGDAAFELDETFVVSLTSPVNAAIGDGQGTATIRNDDPLPTLSITGDTAPEGDSGLSAMLFKVLLSSPSAQQISVQYATALASTGTLNDAEADDFAAAAGTISFRPGETEQWITIGARGDDRVESDERFFVNLSNPVGATIAAGAASGVIGDDEDILGQLSIENAVVLEGGTAEFIVAYTGGLFSPTAHVRFSVNSGSAASGSDFGGGVNDFELDPGGTFRILVDTYSDLTYEADEHFVVTISSTNVDVDDGSAIGVILDQDDAPVVSISSAAAVTEGNGGTTNAVFTVTRSGATQLPIMVPYSTIPGTAQAGSDYVPASGLLTFAPGENSKQITVAVLGDTNVEFNETFSVSLSAPQNGRLGTSQGQATINNDDLPQVTISDVSMAEGDSGTTNAVFTLSLSQPSPQTVSVLYSTANGSALGADYTSKSGTVFFSPNQTSTTLAIAIRGDTSLEQNETFLVNLSGASNATIADAQGVGTIIDDDAPALVAAGSGEGGDPVATQAQLDTMLAEVVQAWGALLGDADARVASLQGLQIAAVELDGDTLGVAEGGTILVDADAAGHGWFVDLTPADSSEFAIEVDRGVFEATESSEAFGRMDLLTVLVHEIGHLLGFDHEDAAAYPVMREELAKGVRYAVNWDGSWASPHMVAPPQSRTTEEGNLVVDYLYLEQA